MLVLLHLAIRFYLKVRVKPNAACKMKYHGMQPPPSTCSPYLAQADLSKEGIWGSSLFPELAAADLYVPSLPLTQEVKCHKPMLVSASHSQVQGLWELYDVP